MKRLITMLALVAMMSSLTGCCCWWPWSGNNCGGGYGGGGACGPAGCAPGYGNPQYAPAGTTSYQTYDSVTGLPLSTTTAYQPVIAAPAVSLGPLEALPTYR